ASHGATAASASTMVGWSTGVPQAPGMWFQIELPQPSLVTEVQFDSPGAPRNRRGNLAPAPAPGAPPGPAGRAGAAAAGVPAPAGYPRAYSVQVSMDGKKWSKPVAQGAGERVHTTIAFAPARAQFVRITQTDNIADAPPWSIRNLRVYEARAAA